VQAHALGEVGILGIVFLRVYSETFLPIFIEIGSYLTDKEQKISWHSFFWDTVYIRENVKIVVYIHLNGHMQWLIHRKQQKSVKGDITHHHIA